MKTHVHWHRLHLLIWIFSNITYLRYCFAYLFINLSSL